MAHQTLSEPIPSTLTFSNAILSRKAGNRDLVSENELTAVECALRQSFLVGHGAC